MNLAQKIAVASTLLAAAVFLFLGSGSLTTAWGDFGEDGAVWQAALTTAFNVAGVVLVGGAVTLLLGIKRKRPGSGG